MCQNFNISLHAPRFQFLLVKWEVGHNRLSLCSVPDPIHCRKWFWQLQDDCTQNVCLFWSQDIIIWQMDIEVKYMYSELFMTPRCPCVQASLLWFIFGGGGQGWWFGVGLFLKQQRSLANINRSWTFHEKESKCFWNNYYMVYDWLSCALEQLLYWCGLRRKWHM